MDSSHPFMLLNESDTFDDFDETFFPPEGTFPSPDNIPLVQYDLSPSDSSDDNVHVVTDPTEDSIKITDVKNVRSVISSTTNFAGGSLTNYLKNVPGLIILPLSAVTFIRKPSGGHIYNPKALVYIPNKGIENYSHLPNFNQAIGLVHS